VLFQTVRLNEADKLSMNSLPIITHD